MNEWRKVQGRTLLTILISTNKLRREFSLLVHLNSLVPVLPEPLASGHPEPFVPVCPEPVEESERCSGHACRRGRTARGAIPSAGSGQPYRRRLSSPVCKHRETIKNRPVGPRKLRLLPIPDIHLRSCLHQVKQFQQILVPHADTADGAGFAHFHAIGTSMNVDIPAHGVHLPQAIEAWFAT